MKQLAFLALALCGGGISAYSALEYPSPFLYWPAFALFAAGSIAMGATLNTGYQWKN